MRRKKNQHKKTKAVQKNLQCTLFEMHPASHKLLEQQQRIQPVAMQAVSGMKKSKLVTIISFLCMQSLTKLLLSRGEHVADH